MQCSRRIFVQQSLGVAGALIAGERAIGAEPSAAVSPANGELFARMTWMNPPESVKREGKTN